MSRPDPVKMQRGVIRTNCMDNLDRTNVVQAAVAKWTLNYQLKVLGVFAEGEDLDDFHTLSRDFRERKFLSQDETLLNDIQLISG